MVGSKSYPLPRSVPVLRHGPTDQVISLLRGDGSYATFEAMFKSQPLVYAAITKLSNAIARNPLKVYQYADENGDSRDRVRSHPLAQLVKRPQPRGSSFAMKARIAQDMLVHGEAISVKFRPSVGAPPTEIWPVPMNQVQVIRDESGVIGYEIYVGVQAMYLGPEDVIHFELNGGSPLRPLARTLALEDASMTWQGQSLAQGMTKRGAFVTDQRLNDQSIPRLRAELEQLYSGVENAGKVALLEQGLKFQEVGVTAVDADLINQRRLSREEVCAAFDLPPALLGLERATYASVSEFRKALYDSVATRLTLIEETFQAQLVDQEPSWDGLFVEFDTSDLLRPDPEARSRTHMMNQQSGVSTVNERRRVENLPRIDDPMADTVFVPVNMMPLGVDMPIQDSTAGTPAQGLADQVMTAAITQSFQSDINQMLMAEES